MKTVMAALRAKGWKVFGHIRQFYRVETPQGERGILVRQGPNCWHFFWSAFEGSSSGMSIDEALKGGLGDAIGTDSQLRGYRSLMIQAPEKYLRQCSGLYRCSVDAFNS